MKLELIKKGSIRFLATAVITVVLFAAGCGGGSSVIAPTTGTVSGTVLDSNGAPVAGAVVVIGTSSWTTTTNINGEFVVANVPAGTQPFRIEAGNGFFHKSGNITVSAGTDAAVPAAASTMTADADATDNPVLSAAAITKSATTYDVTITVTVTDADTNVSAVSAACPELEMSKALNDAGTGGDVTAADGIYSATVSLTANQTAMLSNWHISAYDAANNASNVISLTYGTTSTTSISQLFGRDSKGASTAQGNAATIEGIVLVDSSILANKKLRIHIQDSTGGIGVGAEEDIAGDLPSVAPGDKIRVTGIITQEPVVDNSIGTIYLKINSTSDLTIVSSGNTLPDPYEISGTTSVATYQSEGPELGGKLVKLKSVQLVDSSEWPKANAKSSDVQVKDAAGNIMVMRIQKNSDIKGTTAPAGSFDVVGLVRQDDTNADGDYNDGYVIWPRMLSDITEL